MYKFQNINLERLHSRKVYEVLFYHAQKFKSKDHVKQIPSYSGVCSMANAQGNSLKGRNKREDKKERRNEGFK